VHLDGYNFLPYFQGEVQKGPREQIVYFGQGGELNAIRWNDWKVHFGIFEGNIATGIREVPNWPLIINLRADPYEEMWEESPMYLRWYGDNIWLFVPVLGELKKFFLTIPEYPFQEGSSLSAGNINYNTLKAMKAMKMLQELEERFPTGQ
jgi:arylsulfatase